MNLLSTEQQILSLTKIITALYFENMAADEGVGVLDEIEESLSYIEVTNNMDHGLGSEVAAVEALKATVDWMVDSITREKIKFSRDNIIQRMILNLHCDNQYIEVVKRYLDEKVTPEDARSRVVEIMSELRYDRKNYKIRELIAKANSSINFKKEVNDTNKFIHGLVDELEELNAHKDGEIVGFVGRVNFTNYKEIEAVLEKTAESQSGKGVLNTGFQGLNRSTGMDGLCRGDLVNFAGTTHNYKSGMLIDMALNIPMYNDPWMWDETKKPLILRISFENTLDQDIGKMYKKLHELKYQERCKISDINTQVAAKELSAHFGQKGYHFALECFDPSNFSIYNLFDVMYRYMANNYEIHVVACDYITMIEQNTPGDKKHARITKTYEMARNFCRPKGISFLTAHQLSTEALALQRENTTTFTRKVCTGGWYEECKNLHTKLDLEYVLGIHKHMDGNKYLFVSRGKHRDGENTPEDHCHFIRKFEKFGGIVPDIGTDDKTLYRLPDLMNVDSIGIF